MDFRYSQYDPRADDLRKRIADLEKLFRHLVLALSGDVEQALRHLERIGKRLGLLDRGFGIDDFRRWLERDDVVRAAPGEQALLTSRGERTLRSESLDLIFSRMRKGEAGDHRVPALGEGLDRTSETREWAFGDDLSLLDPTGSLREAARRSDAGEIELREDDLRVFETESTASCATVLLVDVSHSMVLYGEDRITPAKRVALALVELIETRYPKDSIEVVLFGDHAWRVPVEELPYVSVGPYHTNTREGLQLARDLLRRKRHSNRQIFLLTDGKPSALTEIDGTLYKNPFGLDRRVVNKTLEEAAYCRRLGLQITTFMLTDDPTLVSFVDDFTRACAGRAYYTGLDRLGSFVFVDYLRNRKRRVR
jgi:Ca-activated chloride channel homolog